MPWTGRYPIEYDDDEAERLVEVGEDTELVEAYINAQADYQAAYAQAEDKKLVRDFWKSKLVAVVSNETGTVTVGGTRRLSVKVSTTNRIDTKRLRNEAPDIARMYEIESTRSAVDLI